MGLFAAPEPVPDLARFTCAGFGPAVEVLVDRALLASRHLRKGALRVAIEGHGRFQITLSGFAENPSGSST